MSKRRVTSLVVGLIVLVSATLFVVTLIRAEFYSARDEISVPEDTTLPQEQFVASAQAITPDRLIIPAITVDAHVQQVGISKHNTMAVPTNYTDVGWYRYGSKPGDRGKAVFDGHLDNGFGRDAVFKHLKDLKIGDDIYVKDLHGIQVHYKVTGFQNYNQNATSTAAIFSKTGPAEIEIITCEGIWNPATKMYSQRLIVTGKLVGG